MYRGKITHEEIAPKGQLAKEKKVYCTIEKIGGYDEVNVSAKRINALHGLFNDKTPSFGSYFKKLSVRYTFLGNIRRFLSLKRKSKLAEHPAEEIAVDNSIDTVISTPLAEHPANEIVHEEKIWFSTKVRLVSYFRAPIDYVRHLFFERVTKLLSCEGKIARSIRTMQVTRASKATKGEGVLARSKDNTFCTSKQAVAQSAPSDVQTLEHTMTGTSHEAVASAGGGADVVIDAVSAIGHTAKLVSWVYPELVGDELTLIQAFGAVQNGIDLEVT